MSVMSLYRAQLLTVLVERYCNMDERNTEARKYSQFMIPIVKELVRDVTELRINMNRIESERSLEHHIVTDLSRDVAELRKPVEDTGMVVNNMMNVWSKLAVVIENENFFWALASSKSIRDIVACENTQKGITAFIIQELARPIVEEEINKVVASASDRILDEIQKRSSLW